MPKDIGDSMVMEDTVAYITKKDAERLAKYRVQLGDIVYSRRGDIERCALIREENIGALCGTGCLRVRPDSTIIDSTFLSYYLRTPKIRKWVVSNATGATMPNLNTDVLNRLPMEFPILQKQKEIGRILDSFDKKITLNNRLNATLEAMAKTLYDYWFVQFDFPDEKGRPYKTSGGKMVYNEELGREIPAGWEVVPLTTVCKIVDCLHSQKPDKFYESEEFFLLQLENLVPLGLVDMKNKYYVKSADYELWTSKIEIQEGDLLITNAGRVGAFSRVPKGIRAGIGRNITAIRPQQISAIYLYYYLHSVDCKRQIRLNTDVGAFFDSLNVKGLKNMYVLLPPKRLMQLFDKQGGHCRERLESAAKESERLAALRDWLLPMLMNGQVGFRKGF